MGTIPIGRFSMRKGGILVQLSVTLCPPAVPRLIHTLLSAFAFALLSIRALQVLVLITGGNDPESEYAGCRAHFLASVLEWRICLVRFRRSHFWDDPR